MPKDLAFYLPRGLFFLDECLERHGIRCILYKDIAVF